MRNPTQPLTDKERECIAAFLGTTIHWRGSLKRRNIAVPVHNIWGKINYDTNRKDKLPTRIRARVSDFVSVQVDFVHNGCWYVRGFPATLKVFVHTLEPVTERHLLFLSRVVDREKLIDVTNQSGDWNKIVRAFVNEILEWTPEKYEAMATSPVSQDDLMIAHAMMELEHV